MRHIEALLDTLRQYETPSGVDRAPKFLSFLGRFWGYFRPYRRLELEHFNHVYFLDATKIRVVYNESII